ncbi:MAG: hypothetical protein M1818_005494 [Claussenomyces sp. TS43310]|nr:MAG: hypothetical protein M1818_005494 [Claussenomyces sp. TS43310]
MQDDPQTGEDEGTKKMRINVHSFIVHIAKACKALPERARFWPVARMDEMIILLPSSNIRPYQNKGILSALLDLLDSLDDGSKFYIDLLTECRDFSQLIALKQIDIQSKEVDLALGTRPSIEPNEASGRIYRPWSRLRPVNLDPLESFGLPSKGDNRLLDYKNQERYYTKIVDRWMSFCSGAGCSEELLRRLASLNITKGGEGGLESVAESPTAAAMMSVSPNHVGNISALESQRDLSVLIMAMRKLREGIVASKRIDIFSTQVYIFCIRFSILVKHMESYQPAILYLLHKIHPVSSLSKVELQEFAGYLVLDLACRQGDLAQAHAIRKCYSLRDSKVDAILKALVHDNYYMFWKIKNSVDGHKAKLMEFAEQGIRTQALKSLGRTYLSVDLEFLEHVTNSSWAVLVAQDGVGWELQGKTVIIRKPKGR